MVLQDVAGPPVLDRLGGVPEPGSFGAHLVSQDHHVAVRQYLRLRSEKPHWPGNAAAGPSPSWWMTRYWAKRRSCSFENAHHPIIRS